ncbi:MAG: tRNA pseudouridine(55) synthase TruB [Oligoflexia bacterium]|nr:tRNA pseudouridine(55) synthase TruB [Oligoflexia bacterium]
MKSDGILLLDKPSGLSSANALNQIKKKFKLDKIGHGGTLDPFASGLLVVMIGEATKVARFLLEGEKSYIAKMKLGSNTTTGDPEGELVERKEITPIESIEWKSILSSFLGKSKQTPPIYSAIKIKGKPLYEYARKGISVEIPSREIYLTSLSLISNQTDELEFSVTCSGGTYIRVLAEDIAKKSKNLGHLIELRRTTSSNFSIENAISLASLLDLEEIPQLYPMLSMLQHLPKVFCNKAQVKKITQGNLAIFEELKEQIIQPGYFICAYKEEDKILPVAICNHHPMLLPFCSIERVFDAREIET